MVAPLLPQERLTPRQPDRAKPAADDSPDQQQGARAPMIDNFSLGLTHALMLIAVLILMKRRDLDDEPPGDTSEDPPRA